MQEMERLFEKCKVNAFLYKDAALLGTILSKLNFSWDSSIETACAGATILKWNPDWFKELPERTRVTVLLHELWHVARLHMIRRGSKDPLLWNIACDYRINNDLKADGYDFTDAGGLLDPKFDNPRMTEEEIYKYFLDHSQEVPAGCSGDLDYSEPGSEEEVKAVQIVQSANEYAKSCGMTTDSQIEEILAKALKPKVPWKRLLRQFFMDVSKDDYTWKRPNRRYEDIYLPSMLDSEKLTSLNYYIDTSGSIETKMLERFNAELKYIWEDLKPDLIRVINFDSEIQSVTEITPDKPFKSFKFTGRGGTYIQPVMEHIEKTKPVAAIIFTDMCFRMVNKFPKVPIIWIAIDNHKVTVPYGKIVHISQEELNGTKR